MTDFNFDAPIDRHGTDSLKFDRAESRHRSPDLLSLWVADMDFQTPHEVVEAVVERTRHGIFGYTEPGDDYFESATRWLRERHGWQTEADWFVITPGVVFGLAACVRAFTRPGDAVIIQPPVYYPFFEVVRANGRTLVEVPLAHESADATDKAAKEGNPYAIDFDAFERAARESNAKLFLLCSPHNPVGRIWREDELRRLGEICERLDILVASDEIHADFERPGHKHVPFASLSPQIAARTVTLTSASKTFNLAGLHVAHAIAPNAELLRRFKAAVQACGYSQGNTLGLAATKAAFDHGGPWLDALLQYLEGNWAYLGGFLRERTPELKLVEAEGTYLAWIDCRALGMDDAQLQRFILDDARLWLDQGHIFGAAGSGFIRINIATQRSYLQRALEQLEAAVGGLR